MSNTSSVSALNQAFISVIAIVMQFAFAPASQGAVSIEFSAQTDGVGTSYHWAFYDFFDPADGIQSVDVSSPTGGTLGMPFDNYVDFRNAVTGQWTIEASFNNGNPDAELMFEVTDLPDVFPLISPVILSPGEGDTVQSGQSFFPTLDPATVGTGFLSRTRFNSPDLTASFETGGTYNGFRATLNAGVSEADFRFAYTNIEQASDLASNFSGDDTLLEGIDYLFGSGTRTVNVTAVPEPGTALAMLAIVTAGLIRRQRR
ncbi:PEP-CTERM sorting domain-containing protein [Rubripirellula lacrimiformis]|nr:PEP-CTERM sorting domain-containing protein [Rubripirellula lacrimiformis]